MRNYGAIFAQRFERALFAVAASFGTRYETSCFPNLVLDDLENIL